METIAFSAKSLDWKTRYSFTPLAYAKSNNKFVSFTKPDDSPPDASGVHLHDSSQQYNTFYDVNHKSSISIVTNNDPSATKIFEAFSVEGSKGDWSAEFRTSTGEEQYSSFPANTMIEKEGKHYIDIPKNTLNKSMMLTYVGETTIKFLKEASSYAGNTETNKIRGTSKIHSIPSRLGFMLPSYTAEQLYGFGLGQQEVGDFIIISDDLKDNVFRYVESLYSRQLVPFDSAPFGLEDHFIGVGNETELIDEAMSEDPYRRISYEAFSNSIIYDANAGGNQSLSFDYQPFAELWGDDFGFLNTQFANLPISIYSVSYVEQNGEDMRGEYMIVDIERSGTDYYELYAINVDQHKTKLDHSLGQNN